jgi:hypothetical protein
MKPVVLALALAFAALSSECLPVLRNLVHIRQAHWHEALGPLGVRRPSPRNTANPYEIGYS